MARWTFAFSNGVYNDWHRKYDGIAMIDIDSIECCPRCYEPLAILIDDSKLPLPSTTIWWLEEDIVEYACEP